MHSLKLDKQPYVSLDKVVPPNQLGRDVLFSVSLLFQKLKTGTRDLSNSCDIEHNPPCALALCLVLHTHICSLNPTHIL